MPEKTLPKILYFSDVPVELSFAGPTLIYRLFQHYPKDKILVVQGMEINSDQRLAGVTYKIFNSKLLERLRNTRLSKSINLLLLAYQFRTSRRLSVLISEYKPDVIVTVSFRLMWLKAFRISKQLNIPLHVILHDDWLTTENYGKWHPYLSRLFGKMYRHAAGRFCVSSNMEAYYQRLYGIGGQLLYPFRAKEDVVFPVIQTKKAAVLKYCYAGSLYTGDFPIMLNTISCALEMQGSELHIFSQVSKDDLGKFEHLVKPHVIFHGMLHPEALMKEINREMDVAILLNSFLYEKQFRYNFSSKLVDYTSAGLAVLFWGPKSSGSIAWALSTGYSGVVMENDIKAVTELLEEYKDENKRISWAKQMTASGASQFSYLNNYNIFIDQLARE